MFSLGSSRVVCLRVSCSSSPARILTRMVVVSVVLAFYLVLVLVFVSGLMFVLLAFAAPTANH